MIIVEGPDGAGKDTLIEKLLASDDRLSLAPKMSTSLGGPKVDIAYRVGKSAQGEARGLIYNRHSMVSELIYGPTIRGNNQLVRDQVDVAKTWKSLIDHLPLVIVCLPPLPVVISNVKNTADSHMRGVAANIRLIWWQYYNFWVWTNAVRHDYTRYGSDESTVRLVKDYLDVMDFKASRGELDSPGSDRLEQMFIAQAALIREYNKIEANNGAVVVSPTLWGELDDRQVQIRLKDLSQRATEELMEAMNELKNKPWRKTNTPTATWQFQRELMDFISFTLELLITAGLNASDLYELYMSIHKSNEERIEGSY